MPARCGRGERGTGGAQIILRCRIFADCRLRQRRAMLDRVSVGVMLLDLLDNGSDSPTPGSCPGRAPVAGFAPDGVWARAGNTIIPITAAVAKFI